MSNGWISEVWTVESFFSLFGTLQSFSIYQVIFRLNGIMLHFFRLSQRLPTEVFLCFFFSCKANARVKPAKMGTVRTLPNFCVVVCIYCFVSFSIFFVCICVLYYCHRLATQLQLNTSYHISYYMSYYYAGFRLSPTSL
jgi:hypothetical protein